MIHVSDLVGDVCVFVCPVTLVLDLTGTCVNKALNQIIFHFSHSLVELQHVQLLYVHVC